MFTWIILGVIILFSSRLLLYFSVPLSSIFYTFITLGPLSCFSKILIKFVLSPSELLLEVIVVKYSGF